MAKSNSLLLMILMASIIVSCSKEAKVIINPVIPGFNPDPSVCRVGDDYYLVTSTFEYFPGVPVYHSKDLVNWEMIGHVIDRPDQLDFSNVSSTAGIYAPTIRYHDGKYYMITTLVGGTVSEKVKKTGNFITTATNPAGPWSDPHWIENAPGIDPSLFFDDDGKVYYCGNRDAKEKISRVHWDIWIQEIDPNTYELKGEIGLLESKPYFDNDIIGSPVAFEAPHLYKKDGIYYLLIAHGGTGMGHAVSIWKSNSPLGPWEMNPANPVLTNRDNSQSGVNCTGHADIIQSQNGSWYSVYLGVRSNDKKNNVMGRETFVTPVSWDGIWPIFNPGINQGKTEIITNAPELFDGKQLGFDFEDEFRDENLKLQWTMIRNPKSTWWELNPEEGHIEINLLPEVIDNYTHPAFMGIRIIDKKVECETKIDFQPQKENECAGLAFLRGHKPNWSLVKEMTDGKLKASVYYTDSLISQVDLKTDEPIEMRIRLEDFQLEFWVKESDSHWQSICTTDGSEMGFPPAGRFTGAFAGLYATSKGNASASSAKFEYYKMKKVVKNL